MASKKNKRASRESKPEKSEAERAEERAKAEREASIWTLGNDEIERLIDSGERREELREMFGPEVYDELVRLKRLERSRGVRRGGPIVWIVPGIMGSKLGRERWWLDDVIWVDPIDVVAGNLRDLADLTPAGKIVPVGAFDIAYLLLKMRLRSAGFDVSYWPYDWRKSLKESGARLRRDILASKKPVHLVCHSMGGLVAREAMRGGELTTRKVPRVVQLATPNRGSFAPALALTDEDDVVEKLAFLDGLDDGKELIEQVFSKFPGLFELIPRKSQLGDLDLWKSENWPRDFVPDQAMLNAASKVVEDLPPPDERFCLIAGVNQDTVVGGERVFADKRTNTRRTAKAAQSAGAARSKADGKEVVEFRWWNSRAGDGTVPLEFARMEGLKTWYVEASHGSIANHSDLARAVTELLRNGDTSALPH